MPILPFRGLSERGILKDPAPYSLPPNAWSDGSNVFFEDGKVRRSPVFRQVYNTFTVRPWFCWAYRSSSGFDTVHVQNVDGTINSYVSGSLTNVTPVGHTSTVTTGQSTTATFLGDVSYVNNPSDVPYYFGPTSTAYTTLPGWDPTWRCASLRTFGNYLIALNVTKGALNIPNLFKWSDLALDGLPPGSWNQNDQTTNAGENPLEQMDSALIDGLELKNAFIVYSGTKVAIVEQTGTQAIFTFETLYNEGGIVSPNCVVEVEGIHYVFGVNDLYAHDGTGSGKKSLVDQTNRKYIFRNVDFKLVESCFVQHLPFYKKVIFAWSSGESGAAFPQLAGCCNRAFVYDIPSGAGSFIDLPNVTSITSANLNSGLLWSNAGSTQPRTWANTGGTWWDQRSGLDQHPIGVSVASGPVTANRLVAYDYMNLGSVAFPYIAELNGPVFIRRDGLDMEAEGSDLMTYKMIRRIFPQAVIHNNAPITVTWGGTATPGGVVQYVGPVTFNPATQYKVDGRTGGRYLSIVFAMPTAADMEFSGFDVDVNSAGRR